MLTFYFSVLSVENSGSSFLKISLLRYVPLASVSFWIRKTCRIIKLSYTWELKLTVWNVWIGAEGAQEPSVLSCGQDREPHH